MIGHGNFAKQNFTWPAVAVIRRMQALSGFTGRKGSCRWLAASYLKSRGLTSELGTRWVGSREIEERGTDGGAVKCVDIVRNTKGEGTFLGLSPQGDRKA